MNITSPPLQSALKKKPLSALGWHFGVDLVVDLSLGLAFRGGSSWDFGIASFGVGESELEGFKDQLALVSLRPGNVGCHPKKISQTHPNRARLPICFRVG